MEIVVSRLPLCLISRILGVKPGRTGPIGSPIIRVHDDGVIQARTGFVLTQVNGVLVLSMVIR